MNLCLIWFAHFFFYQYIVPPLVYLGLKWAQNDFSLKFLGKVFELKVFLITVQ